MQRPSPSHDRELTTVLGSMIFVREEHIDLVRSLRPLDSRLVSDWLEVGVSLFSHEELPGLRELAQRAQIVLLRAAMRRYQGNITHMASALKSSRRAVRERLQEAGLYEQCRTLQGGVEEIEDVPQLGAPQSLGDEDDVVTPIPTTVSRERTRISRETIIEAARKQHPTAFVHSEHGSPVLVDDGLAWLLFFHDWWDGCRYTLDGEDMGQVQSLRHLEQILGVMAETHGEADQDARDAARLHIAGLERLESSEIHRWARDHAAARMEGATRAAG